MIKKFIGVTAEYLDVLENNGEQINFCDHGVQLTRGFRALKFWMSLKTFGLESFRSAIDLGIDNAEMVQGLIEINPNWEVVTKASIGTINFCYKSVEQLHDNFHSQIARDIILDGFAFITPTRVNDQEVLRICAINPRTTLEDYQLTLEKLEDFAASRLSKK